MDTNILRARRLAVSDLRSGTKGSRFEPGCRLYAEMSPPQQPPGQHLSAYEAGESGRDQLNRYPPTSPGVP